MSNLCIHINNCNLADDGKHQEIKRKGKTRKTGIKTYFDILIVYDYIDLAKKDSLIEEENLEAITEVIVHN